MVEHDRRRARPRRFPSCRLANESIVADSGNSNRLLCYCLQGVPAKPMPGSHAAIDVNDVVRLDGITAQLRPGGFGHNPAWGQNMTLHV